MHYSIQTVLFSLILHKNFSKSFAYRQSSANWHLLETRAKQLQQKYIFYFYMKTVNFISSSFLFQAIVIFQTELCYRNAIKWNREKRQKFFFFDIFLEGWGGECLLNRIFLILSVMAKLFLVLSILQLCKYFRLRSNKIVH